MTTDTVVEYLADEDVTDTEDMQLRNLLSICFTKPEDQVFLEKRYFREPPQHRWVIRDQHVIVAHVAVHDKTIGTEAGDVRIGGVAEVCVRPDYRKRGYVRIMLREAHEWLIERAFPFAMLFGDPKVYTSSGYFVVDNVLRYWSQEAEEWVEANSGAMVCQLLEQPWPSGKVDLRGPTF